MRVLLGGALACAAASSHRLRAGGAGATAAFFHDSASDAAAAAAARGALGVAAAPPPPRPAAPPPGGGGGAWLAAAAEAREPNAGPFWYLSLVVFGRFLPLFRVLFLAPPALCALPLCARLAAFPRLAAGLALSYAAVLRPRATLADGALVLCVAAQGSCAFRDGARRALDGAPDGAEARATLRAKLAEAAVFAVAAGAPAAAANAALYQWQVAATGNANFWYFLSLTQCFALTVLAGKALAWFAPRRAYFA